MNIPSNPFKSSLQRRPSIGIWSMLSSAPTIELLSHSGFDWMLLDMEHGPTDVSTLRQELMALNGSRTAPVVRVKWNDMVELKRVLDLGVQTVMIPQVHSVAEARNAVAYTRYPPAGVRGVAGGTRATRYGRIKDYYRYAEQELCVLIQVESRAAMDDLSAIAAIDSVDGIFIGPSDFAASIGHLGNPAHADVQTAIYDALKIIHAAGKAAGTIATQEASAQRMIELGFDFVAVGIDVGLLAQAADALLAKFVEGGHEKGGGTNY